MNIITLFLSSNVLKLSPGLVFVPNLLTIKQEKRLLNMRPLNHRLRFAEPHRKRLYADILTYPNIYHTIYRQYIDVARQKDHSLPDCDATHLLTNVYTNEKGLLWHRDIYANDGDGNRTIINLSLGASCIFGYELNEKKYRIKLRSGEALLFGGECRFIKHRVERICLDECPKFMKNPYRVSLTFRDSPSMFGNEHNFETFSVNTKEFEESQKLF